ncbi:MAG TPA: hypothetical protein VMU42_14875, partial [Candidatus Sulfotelmatobacter sp.]|nr:hypothetical protein [Candidatus Sulfotelmatobacter sp.]
MTSDSRAAATAKAFIRLAGATAWARRIAEFGQIAAAGPHVRRAVVQRHSLELSLDRFARGATQRAPTCAEQRVLDLAQETLAADAALAPPGRTRLRALLHECLTGKGSLVPLFHLMRTAALQRAHGFAVSFRGLAENAPFDLLLER